MGKERKTAREVMMTPACAVGLISELAAGIKKGDLVVKGKKRSMTLSPAAEMKMRLRAKEGGHSVKLDFSWRRPRELRAEAARTAGDS